MEERITLKHLCQRYELDPHKLRKHLRTHLKHQSNQRWKWKPNDPQLKEAEDLAKSLTKQPD